MSRHILVTGGAGYIGAHVCKALAAAGHVPVAYDNLGHGHREAVKWGPLIEADLADRAALARALARHSIAAVIHLAAFIEVGESVREPGKYFRNNFVHALGLFETMLDAGVKAIVVSSTASVYGVPERTPLTEDHPTRPINPYGESKLMVERALDWFGRAQGLNWLALRYFNAAGADPDGEIGEDHEPESHLIPIACQAALGRRAPFEIYGTDYPTPDGTAIRDYVHVADLAAAHLAALDDLLAGGASGAFNLGTGVGHSVASVIQAVEAAAGRSVPVRHAARRPGDSAVLVADPSAARRRLGWTPRIPGIEAIVASAWRWHVKRHGPPL